MVNAAAAEAGLASAFAGDIAASIDYGRLAAAHTRCRICRLYRSRLPGARDLSLMVHERYVAGGSVREIEAAVDQMISRLGWRESLPSSAPYKDEDLQFL